MAMACWPESYAVVAVWILSGGITLASLVLGIVVAVILIYVINLLL